MSARGGSASGGRKMLILAGAILFIAAACNSQTATNTGQVDGTTKNRAETKSSSKSKADAALNALNVSIESENSINMQSDDDVINTDKSVTNNVDGVANVKF